MKTAKHPFSKVVHYSAGGTITAKKAEFKSLCGMKFEQGHDELMKSGWGWKEYCTCKKCKGILEREERKKELAEKIRADAEKKVRSLYK